MSKNKEAIFSLGIGIYSEKEQKYILKILPGNEKLIANILFTMVTGEFVQLILKQIQKLYPNQYDLIQLELESLVSEFQKTITKFEEETSNIPVVPPTKVFHHENDK